MILLVGVFLAGIVPISAYAQSAGPVYVVQSGDTLYTIAQRFGTTVEDIASINDISDPSLIAPGMKLIIPGYEGVSGELSFYEIGFGESLYSISNRFDLPLDALAKLNHVLHPNRMYVGQAVIVTQEGQDSTHSAMRTYLADEGLGKLEFAARKAINPWELRDREGYLDRAWITDYEGLLLPSSDQLDHPLPEPFLEVQVKPERVVQGRTLTVMVQLDQNASLGGQFVDWSLNFFDYGELRFVALQGVNALTEAGMYDLEVSLWDDQGGKKIFNFQQPVRVVSGEYYYDPVLYVSEETIDPAITKPEDELIVSITSQITQEKYWEEIFQYPSAYTESFPSYFGSRRNYNDQGYNSYHTGLDFYGGTGTPIYAPAKGKVVFTGSLDVRGNVTFIDHGWGVFTGYLHQSEIDVAVGDWVEPGQVIGLVGETGRVTGPHLHWEIWVGGNPVDPLEWVAEEFP